MPPAPSPSSNSRKPLVVFLLVVSTGVLIFAGIRFFHRGIPAVEYLEVKRPQPGEAHVAGPAAVSEETGKTAAPAPGKRREVPLPVIFCLTGDTAGHGLKVGLKLVIADKSLEREIRNKEPNILQLVKFVFAKKLPSQINAENARRELLDRINAFLSGGKVEDIVFTEFDIVPMEIK